MNIKFVAKFTILLTVLLISNIDVASASSDNKIRVTFKKDANTAALTRILECAPAKDRKSTRLNSSHSQQSRMPSSA